MMQRSEGRRQLEQSVRNVNLNPVPIIFNPNTDVNENSDSISPVKIDMCEIQLLGFINILLCNWE